MKQQRHSFGCKARLLYSLLKALYDVPDREIGPQASNIRFQFHTSSKRAADAVHDDVPLRTALQLIEAGAGTHELPSGRYPLAIL